MSKCPPKAKPKKKSKATSTRTKRGSPMAY